MTRLQTIPLTQMASFVGHYGALKTVNLDRDQLNKIWDAIQMKCVEGMDHEPD